MSGGFQREKDLGSRLRSTDDAPWSSLELSSVLNENSLTEMKQRFNSLYTSAKLRILFSFLELPRRMAVELKDGIAEIVRLAREDDDEWVRVTGDALDNFVDKQSLNLELEQGHKAFQVALEQLRLRSE